MAIVIGKGAGGGGGSSGFKLGPVPNTFRETGIDSKAAAETARDTYAAANPAWLAQYEANPTITIALEYRDAAGNEVATMQLRDEDGITPGTHIWYDSETFKGLRGIAGDTGLTPYIVYHKNNDPDAPPATPTGTTVPPTGWSVNPMVPAAGEYVWYTFTYVEDTAVPVGDGNWEIPVRDTGREGADAINDSFIIVADPAARLAIPAAQCQIGTRVVQQDTGVMYINITGNNAGAVDWQKANSFDRTYTGDVVMDGDLRYDNDEVHLGRNSGVTNQGSRSVAVGRLAGNADQGDRSVAVGVSAAQVNQGSSSVAIGDNAGENNQGDNATAVGKNAGQTSQGMEGVAIGDSAGMTRQGVRAIAIGTDAGTVDQPDRSIIINANNTVLNKTNEGAFGLHTGGTNQLEIDYDAGVGDNLKINKTVEATGYIGDGIVPTPPATGKVLTSNGTGSGDYTWADPTGGGGGGIVDAPIDGNTYARKDGNWEDIHVADNTWTGSNQFNDDVTTLGKFIGVGAIDNVDQTAGRVLTANSATEGDYTWADAAAGGFDVTADYTVTGDWQFQGDVRSSSNEVHLGNSAGLTTQGANAVAIGTNAGNNTQGSNSVAVGNRAGRVNQGDSSVAIGLDAGNSGQGEDSVAIGHNAGSADQGDNSIIISSKGTDVNNTNDGSLQIETDVVTIRHDGDAGGNIRINQVLEPQGLLTNGGVQVTGTGEFIGKGAVPSAGMNTDFVLTANSATGGDYTWKAATGAAGSSDYRVVDSEAALLSIPNSEITEGMHVYLKDSNLTYVSLTGTNNTDLATDWKDALAYDATVTGNVTFDGATVTHHADGAASTYKSFGSSFIEFIDRTSGDRIGWFGNGGDDSMTLAAENNKDFKIKAEGTGKIKVLSGDTEMHGKLSVTDHVIEALGAGSFSGKGAVPLTGQQPAYVLTSNSTTPGDYVWAVAPGGGGFDTTADYTVTGDWVFNGDMHFGGSQVHFGNGAGQTAQGAFGIAVGHEAGQNNQGFGAIAFGNLSGQTSQGQHSLAAGNQAGQVTQGEYALAVGDNAGSARQGDHALAVGKNAGQTDQGQDALAVGENAGQTSQGAGAIAYGKNAGQTRQGMHSISLGNLSGITDLGENAIAIGNQAGTVNQGANSIVVNSSGTSVSNTHANSFTVHTGELSIDFNGTSTDHLTINKEIDVTNINITAPRLITGVPI